MTETAERTSAALELREAEEAFLAAADRRANELNEGIERSIDRASNESIEYNAAQTEIATLESEIRVLEEEREGIPEKVTRAGLEEDGDDEARLRERYREIRAAVPEKTERIAALNRWCRELVPYGRGQTLEAELYLFGKVASEMNEAHAEAQTLQKKINSHLDATTEDLREKLTRIRNELTGWSNQR